uniref:Ig-like domain-containing protein n=1 Tax=Branchiostoma floridae TaxID=7739 RepID=C3YXQ5_BRAFL|eukprot:XP_002598852.1 hypothetical protein BRAFLDRAFT_74471 [Branchiostoma floridae]
MTVREGQTVTLRCAFIGLTSQSVVIWEGPPNFNVMSTDRRVDSLYKRHRITGNSGVGEYSMEIADVQVSDEGGYRCSTLGLQEKAEMMLNVIVPIKKPPKIAVRDSSIFAGQSLTLSCRTTEGSPLPTLTWFNGTAQVKQRNNKLAEGVAMASLDLVLSELTRWDHGRNFTCMADQGYPQLAAATASSTILNVKYSPVVRIRSQSIQASEGETLDLSCDVDSNPQAAVSWRKLGGDIPANAENREEETTSPRGVTNTLVISHVGRSDGGVYVCETTNTFGTFQREFHMDVKDTNTQSVVIASVTVIVLLILFATIFVCIAKRTGLSTGVNKSREKTTGSTLTASRALPPLPPYLDARSAPAMDPDCDMDGLELQDFNGTLKPRPPPRVDKQPYSIGLSYPSLMHPLPPYSTVERQRPDGEDNMLDSPYLEDPWETEEFMAPPSEGLTRKRIDNRALC